MICNELLKGKKFYMSVYVNIILCRTIYNLIFVGQVCETWFERLS